MLFEALDFLSEWVFGYLPWLKSGWEILWMFPLGLWPLLGLSLHMKSENAILMQLFPCFRSQGRVGFVVHDYASQFIAATSSIFQGRNYGIALLSANCSYIFGCPCIIECDAQKIVLAYKRCWIIDVSC